MQDIEIGIVGCGAFGESHLEALRAVSGAEATAVFDIDRRRSELLASRFSIDRVCSSLAELCSLPGLQIIDVVTPEASHLESVAMAFQHGKHVFVEKPLATDMGHCDQMIEMASRADRFFMVGHLLRFETRYAMLHEEVSHGRMGRVVSMHARRNRPKSQLALCRRAHPAMVNSIHDIDLMLWYTAQPVQKVRGYARHATNQANPDTFWGVLEFAGGTIGIVETIWLIPDQSGVLLDDAFQLVGTEAVANLQLQPGSLAFWRSTGYELPDVSYDPRVMNSARGALREELAYFCDCVRQQQMPKVNSAIDAKRAVRVALALVESANQQRDIEIDEWD